MMTVLRKRFGSRLRRLSNDEKGTSAVEFGIVGPVFLAMLLGALELGLVLTKVALLDNAVAEISRDIYTGAVANGGVTKDQIEDRVCNELSLFDSECKANIAVELTTMNSLSSAPATDAVCIDSDDPITPAVTFNPGVANEIVYMRICVTTDVYMPGIGLGLNYAKTDNGKIQIVSSLAFSNEPF